jgi:hypothetical protein
MRNGSPDFGACLTSFAAGFVRPDNGFSSRLEISGPQKKQEKQNKRAWRTHSKKTLIFQKQCFLSTGNQPRLFPASVSDGFPPGCFKGHPSGDS